MKKRWLIFSCFGLVLTVGLFCAFRNPEPVYLGEPLSFWIRTTQTGRPFMGTQSEEALRMMGKAAVPFLMRDLTAKDTAWQCFCRTNWSKLPSVIRDRFSAPRPAEVRRARAIWALGAIGPAAQSAVPELLRIAQKSSNIVASSALVAMPGAIWSVSPQTPGSVPSKIWTFNTQGSISRAYFQSSLLMDQVLGALVRIGGTNRALIPLLLGALNDPRLIYGTPQTYFAPLVEHWFETGNLAAAAGQSVDQLRSSLSSSNASARAFSVLALAMVAPDLPELVPPLVESLNDSDSGVANMAQRALVKAGLRSAAVLEEIVKAMQRPDPPILLAAVCADLGSCAFEALPTLEALVKSHNKVLSYHAARGLWTIGHDPRAILPLWLDDLTNDKSDQIRWSMLGLIGNLGSRGKLAVPAVIRVLREDVNNRVRAKAAMTLKQIGGTDADAIEALQAAQRDDYSNVREAVTDALREMQAFTTPVDALWNIEGSPTVKSQN